MKLRIEHARLLATFDGTGGRACGREIADGAVVIENGVIARVGTTAELADIAVDDTIDASGHVVMPGLVNTHHHMYQNLTRVMVQDEPLFKWLTTLYPIWEKLDDAAIEISARIAMAELLASGCTTSSDHLYILPNDCTLDTTIRVAQEMGLRFHAARGAMSRGVSKGGLPPDSCVEDEGHILRDAERLIHAHHDMSRHSMCRIVLAPCSPFSVTPDLMRDAAALARCHRGVRLHSHIAEVLEEEEYARDMYGCRSVEFAERVGWLADDVWFAHAIFLDDAEIARFAQSGTGATYCPSAHMRCGLGIMRAREMLDAGVTVGLGVDGSASNDTSNMFLEARTGMLLQRVAPQRYLSASPGGRGGFGGTAGALSAREALWMATRGGAALLGRDDIGALAPGMSADVIAVAVEGLGLSGTQADPLAALVLCGPFTASHVVVNGVRVIDNGSFTRVDLPVALETHRQTMQRLH